MRNYSEATAKNLLREPLILGVPLPALIGLTLVVLLLELIFSGFKNGNSYILGFTAISYCGLRLVGRQSKLGWMEPAIFFCERLFQQKDFLKKKSSLELKHETVSSLVIEPALEVHSPDTLDNAQLIQTKTDYVETFKHLPKDHRQTYVCLSSVAGVSLQEVDIQKLQEMAPALSQFKHIYSLYNLPTRTDSCWLFSVLSQLKTDYVLITSIKGLDPSKIKSRIEASRRRNARTNTLSNIDSDVTFEEASLVLEGLSRGDEGVVELSMVLFLQKDVLLDSRYFCKEKNRNLVLFSILSLRPRYHRSHFVRAVTASDLIPNILDPKELGRPILKTIRGKSLYFDPQDKRLEALHWLVVGASGSGKSFLTALILRRLIQTKIPMSVLFVDHNRSFRRVVKHDKGMYLEFDSFERLKSRFSMTYGLLEEPGQMTGIELSDMPTHQKKEATHFVLASIEQFLRQRKTIHPIYIVLDECWNFMRDEPLLVQRAFREFRKLNGAAIAITQSLSDFLNDESGKSILQNAPIRILLRQGEDLASYRGALSLNDIELNKVRLLRQKKGEFSECLVKTPFLSRIGRLYPTKEEHTLLRTDNLREELIIEALVKRNKNQTLIGETSC